MKKILFLLFVTIASYGQTYQNPTFGTVTTKTAPTTTADPYVSSINANGVIGKVAPENIPMNVIPPTTHYTPVTPNLKGHFQGIDNAIGNIPLTTAGNTTRVWFTGDATTITAGTFYLTNATNKGTVANVSQSVTNDDNQKKYFTQDLIGQPFATATLFPPGVYAGNLSASTTPNSAQQRFTVELYKCNNAGTPIASGVPGAPVGDLGVTVVLILDSGLLTLADGSVTNVPVSASLASQFSIAVGERIRYHVSAEKVGTASSNITESVWYGSSFNSFIDVPTPITSNGVSNVSNVTGATVTNALDNLKTADQAVAGAGVAYGHITDGAQTIVGEKAFSDQITLGETTGSPQELWKLPANSLLKYNNLQTSQYGFNITTAGADNFFWVNDEGFSRQCLLYADGDSSGTDSDIFGLSASQDNGVSYVKNFSVTQGGDVYIRKLLNINNATASTIASFDASKNLVSLSTATYPSLTELSYVKGVTSSLQTQLNGKQATLTNPITGVGVSGQVSFWNSISTQTGDNGLVWDNTNKRLGVGVASPMFKLDIRDINGGTFFDGTNATYNRWKSFGSLSTISKPLLISAQASGTTPDIYIHTSGGVSIGNTTDLGAGTLNVTSNISTIAATTANHAVIKSQHDLKADLASPTFTGDPKTPTPTSGDNDTSIANTAFVTGAIATAATSGTYTPTYTVIANLISVTNNAGTSYIKIGNIVTVTVRFGTNETAAGTLTSFRLTLPFNRVNSVLVNHIGSGGVTAGGVLDRISRVYFDTANNSTAVVEYYTTGSFGNSFGSVTFQYSVLE